MFKDNAALCQEVQESEIQYFLHCIEKGRDIRYLQFLQTIMKVHGQPVKRSQDLVMAEVMVKTLIIHINCFVLCLDC